MLHAKFRGHRSVSAGEKRFLKIFTIYGRSGHIGFVTWMVCTYSHSPNPWRFYMKFD